jgi:hypothetical protein
VRSNAANGELGEVVAEVDGSLGDDRLAFPLTYATLSERKAPRIVGPPDGGHIGSQRFGRKSFDDLDDEEDMDAQACREEGK